GAGIARASLHQVAALLDVAFGLFPRQTVLRGSVGRTPFGQIPHFEGFVLRVVPDPVTEDHATDEIRVPGLGSRSVMRPGQGGLSNEEIIHEQLPTDVDGEDRRRRAQIVRSPWLPRSFYDPRWPERRKADAVVKFLVVGCKK